MPATDRFSLIVESSTRGEAELRRFEGEMTRLSDVVERSQRRVAASSQSVARETAQSWEGVAVKLGLTAGAIAAVGATLKATIVDSATYAARTQTLTVVTQSLSRVNNLNEQAVLAQSRALRQQGITTQESLSVINRMIFAQLDLSKATELGRLAQDAAVIAGINSSEALEGIIHGIVTRQPEVLRTYGIVVNFEQEYQKASHKLGRELLNTEKTQIAMNTVLAQGAKIAGTYEAAMGTTGKQLTSLRRFVDEASNAFGNQFQPELRTAVGLLTDAAKFAERNAETLALLTRATIAATAASAAYAVAKAAANAVDAGSGAGLAARIAGLSPAGLVTGLAVGAGFATLQQLGALEDAYRRVFDEPKEAAQKLNAELGKIIAGLKEGTTTGDQFRIALSRALKQEAEGPGRRLIPFAEDNLKEAERAADLRDPAFASFLKRQGLSDSASLLARGGDVSKFARQQLGRQFLDQFIKPGDDPLKDIEKRIKLPPTAEELEATRAKLAEQAKKAEQAVRDFVLRSFDSGLDALDRIAIQGANQYADAITAGQKTRVLASSRRFLDSALSDQSGKKFDKSRSRVTGLEADAAAAVRALESQDRGLPLFVARPLENEGTADQQRAFGEGLLARDNRRLAILQQQVEFEARKTELIAGPGGEVAALERSVQLRLSALSIQEQMGAQMDFQAEKTRILQDRELQLLEIQARRLAEFKNNVQQAFDALVSGGGSGGIRDFVKAQGLGVGRAIVGNLAGEFKNAGDALVLPGQKKADGTPNFLGRILAGTPFASNDLKTATDRNTEATDRNTAALTGGIGSVGGAGGGVLGSVASSLGLPGGLFSGSGSNPFIFSAQSNSLPGMTGTAADSAVNRSIANQLGFNPAGGGSSNLMKGIGAAGLLAGSGFGIYSGLKQGGAQGLLTASSSVLGGAGGLLAMLAPTTGPLAPILLGAALATGVVASLLGDPKKRRQKQIDQMIEEARFTSNDPMAYSMDIYGRSFDSDFRGNFRAGQPIVVQVQAMDSKSFIDHSADIADGVRYAMQQGHGLNQTARETVLGGM